MIDFERFTKEQEVIVPLLQGNFQYNRKKYVAGTFRESGWYKMKISGNFAEPIEPVLIETVQKTFKTVKGYTYHNNIVFQNFDVGKRHSGVEVMAPLHLNNVKTFFSIEAIVWEDKKLYYYRPNYTDNLIYIVKNAYDTSDHGGGTGISNIKGVTPELKTLFLFHDVERMQLLAEQERIRKAQEIEEFKKTLRGRLILAFARVGATVLKYSTSGNKITVDWKLDATGREFNSEIEADTFRVVAAGYCMSGHDRDHSVHSMVKLAETYEEDNLIHITRERD